MHPGVLRDIMMERIVESHANALATMNIRGEPRIACHEASLVYCVRESSSWGSLEVSELMTMLGPGSRRPAAALRQASDDRPTTDASRVRRVIIADISLDCECSLGSHSPAVGPQDLRISNVKVSKRIGCTGTRPGTPHGHASRPTRAQSRHGDITKSTRG